MAGPRRFVGRARSVLSRWWLDGRLPESTEQLLRGWARTRLRRARATPTHPPAHCSLHDLMHDLAGRVVTALEAEGCTPFLYDADGWHLVLGLPVAERDAAVRALRRLADAEPWVLTWRRGHRTRMATLRGGPLPAPAQRAERWLLHQPVTVGAGAVAGQQEAVELTFWGPGEHGRLEQLGVRSLQRLPATARPTTEVVDGRSYPGTDAFPVGRALTRPDLPVDVVYTWVDGSDPEWRAARARWQAVERPHERGDHADVEGRYRSRDELRYSLRSLWLFAGWVRRIYVVTSGQVPPWLVEDERLRVVPHAEILPDDALPTFNSHAIESRLHHIDGLSEHFLYLNDDMFLGRRTTLGQFFTANGLPRFFPSEAWVPLAEPGLPDLAVDTAARNGRALIEERFGRVVERKLHHAPYALRRSTLFEIDEAFGEVVRRTTRSRFRHPDDLSIPSAFAHHYGFATGRAVVGELSVGYQNLENRRLGLWLDRLLVERDYDAFCLNETESDGATEAADRRLAAFLEAYFPIPSPWESDR